MPKLSIDLELKLAQFQDSLNQMTRVSESTSRKLQTAFRGFGTVIGTIVGAAGIAAVTRGIVSVTQAADEMAKASRKVGVTTSALGELKYAADLSGVSFEELQKGLVRLSVNMGDVQKGTGEARDAFHDLGIDVEDSQKRLKNSDVVLAEIADKFAAMQDGATKTALAVKIFGRAGAELIPLLNQGSDGIQALREEAEKLGITFSTETGEAAEKFNDNLKRIEKALDGVKTQIVVGMLPALNDLASALVSTASEQDKWRKVGEDVGDVIREIAVVAVNAAGVINILGQAFSGLVESAELAVTGGISKIPDVFRRIAAERDKIVRETEARVANLRGTGLAQLNSPESGGLATQRRAGPTLTSVEERNKAASAAKAANDALLALQKAQSDAEVKNAQDLATNRLAILDRYHAKGLIGESDYWDSRAQIQKEASDAALKSLNEEVKAREQAAAAAPQGTAEYYKAQKDLLGALEKRNDAEQKFAQDTTKNYLDATDAAEEYGRTVASVTAEVLELKGRTAEAIQLQIDASQEAIRRQAAARGDTGTIVNLDAIRAAKVATAEFNKEREKGQGILDALALQEERIQNSRRVGAITDLEALNATGAARKTAITQLDEISGKLKGIADESGIPTLTKQSSEFQVQLESLATTTNLLADKFDSILSTGLGDLFSELIDGSKSAKDAINDFAKSVTKQINDLIAQNLSQKLFQSVLGGGGTSPGGFLANLFSSGSLFGGSAASATAGISAADLGIAFGGVFAQGGGFTVPGAGGQDSQLVAFKATPGEKVSVSTPQQGGGSVINIHLNNPNFATGESIGQAGTRLGTAINRQLARNS